MEGLPYSDFMYEPVYSGWLAIFRSWGASMTKSAQSRTNVFSFIAVVVASTLSMLWLFWHHPIPTAMATLVVLAGLGISARLARFIQIDTRSDLTHR